MVRATLLDLDRRGRLVALGAGGAAFGALGVAGLAPGSWVAPLTCAVAGAALLVGGSLFAWHRAGGYDLVVGVARAARTGVVPEDADPRVWVPALERYARDLRSARWRYPVVMLPVLIALDPSEHRTVVWVAFCVVALGIELVATVDALVRAPGVTRRVESVTGRLAARWSAELHATV